MLFNIQKYNEILDYINVNNKNYLKIVAISKNHEKKAILEAIEYGIRVFGENRVQEATNKFLFLKKIYNDIDLHLTGPLQTNKVKTALKIFDCFQTLDRKKLVKEFKKYPEIIKNKRFFVQINIGEEENKNGVSLKEADSFISYCQSELNTKIDGLMCIPPMNEKPKKFFLKLKEIALRNNIKNLSMGMSSDYKVGISCGATYLRLGTILFGERVL